MDNHPFVARQCELDDLQGYLDKALAGQGQVCFVAGLPGSGKTALVRRFAELAFASQPDLVLAAGACNAQTGIGDPYLPFREALAMLTGADSERPADAGIIPENARRLRTVLVGTVQVLVEVAPELIGLFVPGGKLVGSLGKAVAKKAGWMERLELLVQQRALAGGPGSTPAEQSRIFEQYTAFVRQLSAKTPLILFVDDLQWADNASLGLLFHLARHLDDARILILGAYRPSDVALGREGKRHPLEQVVNELTRYRGDVRVDLDAIPDALNRQFVDAFLDSEPNALDEPFRLALFSQTGGHALFTVELLRALQERGELVRDSQGRWDECPTLDWNALPARVEGVIEERIGRLGDDLREMLKVASVEGDQFTAEVIAKVQSIAERQAVRQLNDELQRRHRLVDDRGPAQLGKVRVSLYRFVHHLFQRYIYNNLGQTERAYLHRDVGEVMEALFAGQTEEVAAQLARHFEEAGVPGKAAQYRLQAGQRAQHMSAHREAIAHLEEGLKLLEQMPEGPARLRLEFNLQAALGISRLVAESYVSPAAEQALARARELSSALGDLPETFQVLCGQLLLYRNQGKLDLARSEAELLLDLVQPTGNAEQTMVCQSMAGTLALWMCDYDDARQHLEEAVALYDPAQAHHLENRYGMDHGAFALAYLAIACRAQGYLDQALAHISTFCTLKKKLAETADDGASQRLLMQGRTLKEQMLGRWSHQEMEASLYIQLAVQAHDDFDQMIALQFHGEALAHLGQTDEGIAEIKQIIPLLQAAGAGGNQTILTGIQASLADAYLLAGRREDGLQALEACRGDHAMSEELLQRYRLRGELLLLEPADLAAAEASFREALEIARSQKAKLYELQAAISLARLLCRQGRIVEARDLLAPIYAWFTEGFDIPDLQDARALLDELSAA